MKRLAVILVRGFVGMSQPVRDTLAMLSLSRKNMCIVVPDTPVIRGMMQKAKDYITWGEIADETYTKLLKERGKEYKGRLTDSKERYSYTVLQDGEKSYKKYFTLNPPRKGFGRKGIKVSFAAGGALGYRREKINDLIVRML